MSAVTPDAKPGINFLDGTRFTYADPAASFYPVEQIARGLAHTCRFGGHISHWYPVAMHCVNGTYLLDDPEDQYAFLMHDALEGVMGFDPPTPLKWHIPPIKELENSLHPVLAEQHGFKYPYSAAVMKTDTDMLVLENHYLRGRQPLIGIDIDTYDISHLHALVDIGVLNLGRVTPDQAMSLWLQRYEELKP